MGELERALTQRPPILHPGTGEKQFHWHGARNHRRKNPPYTPHFDVPDYKFVGIQLFDMMHSIPKDATEKEDIDDAGLLGFDASPSQWNFFEFPDDGE